MNKKQILEVSKDIDSIVETMGELRKTSDLIEDYAEDNLNLDSMDDTAICLCLERLCQIEDLNRLSSKWLELIKWDKKEAYKNLKEANVISVEDLENLLEEVQA